MATSFQLELVSADRVVWSGEATMVITRTIEGEVGILANHAPLLGVLAPGTVEIRPADGPTMVAAVDGGFLSVANNRISVLAERAAMADTIDLSEAQRNLDAVRSEGGDDDRAKHALAAAEAWVAAAERA
jgi:F-type H+-transporting ATPase subunit epsilon